MEQHKDEYDDDRAFLFGRELSIWYTTYVEEKKYLVKEEKLNRLLRV